MEIDGLLLAILISVALPVVLGVVAFQLFFKKTVQRGPEAIDFAELAAAEKDLKEAGERDWVVVKRCHGPAYTHMAMTEIMGKLAEADVDATYDVIAASSADGGVTNYVIKVIRGEESKALEVLAKLTI